MKKLLAFPLAGLLLLLSGCTPRSGEYDWAKNAIQRADRQLRKTAEKFSSDQATPRSYKDGAYKMAPPKDWTSGFFPGSLWQMYALTGDNFFANQAQAYTDKLDGIQSYKGTHDLGFMVFCSYGNQYANFKDDYTAQVIMDAAASLASRRDPQIGLIRSWDFGEWNYPVIIDNLMNLEMLFWASGNSGDPIYKEVAEQHADLTIKNHFRDDYSAYHVVSYNPDGSVESQGTFQGFGDGTAWARGEAWALYGYTMCYRCTGEERYLEQARKIAAFVMNHPRTPEDLVPYWDYDAPGDAPRDASAGAIYASALLELSTMTQGEESQKYFGYAEKLLRSLSSESYLAPQGENGGFVLMHCVGHLPANSEVDVPLNYADYYYLEGLKRYLQLKGVDSRELMKS